MYSRFSSGDPSILIPATSLFLLFPPIAILFLLLYLNFLHPRLFTWRLSVVTWCNTLLPCTSLGFSFLFFSFLFFSFLFFSIIHFRHINSLLLSLFHSSTPNTMFVFEKFVDQTKAQLAGLPFTRPMSRRRRYISKLGILIALAIATITLVLHIPPHRRLLDLPLGLGTIRIGPHKQRTCPSHIQYLQQPQYNLTRQVNFQRICIVANRSNNVNRHEVANVTSASIASGQTVDLEHGCLSAGKHGHDTFECDQTIKLDVSHPNPSVDLSDILFVVATKLDRLMDSLPQFSHWLGGTNARLLAVVTESEHGGLNLHHVRRAYAAAGVHLIATKPYNAAEHVNVLHFTMIRDAVPHLKSATRWMTIIDDDTFFPSLYSIRRVLDQYDARMPMYVGGMSEHDVARSIFGHMGFGGAGVFLSVPLVAMLEPKIDECFTITGTREGDGMLKACIDHVGGPGLTHIDGLHQMDIRDDPSGFFESGLQPLSLHHWKSWYDAPVLAMAQVTKFCGDCFMHRWRIGDNAVFSNGYSLAVYPDGTDDIDFDKLEATWPHAGDDEYSSLGSFRSALPSEKKKSYTLMDSQGLHGRNELRQVYINENIGQLDDIIEMHWSFH